MYISLRAMKVQGEDGNVRHVKPGDKIPEAAKWKNLRAYINRGWVCQEGTPLSDAAAANMARTIKDRDNSLREAKEFIDKQNEEIRNRGDRISQLASELEEVKGVMSDDHPRETTIFETAAEARDTSEHEDGGDLPDSEATPSASPLQASEDPKLTRKELQKMGKDSLMTLADSMGIDSGQSKNKLVEAIFATQ